MGSFHCREERACEQPTAEPVLRCRGDPSAVACYTILGVCKANVSHEHKLRAVTAGNLQQYFGHIRLN